MVNIFILYFILILMFAYFYMTIQYNPIEMANNLRQNNGTIPGIRPGKPTADFIAKILSKVTLIGALFLAFIAIVPIIYGNVTGLGRLSMGGTSVIIMVAASIGGMFFGALFNNAIGGMILFALISGIACIIHSLDNRNT